LSEAVAVALYLAVAAARAAAWTCELALKGPVESLRNGGGVVTFVIN